MAKPAISPLSNRVVIEPISQEEKTESGILIPDTADKEKPQEGTVVAVGPGKINLQTGERLEMEVSKGDTVLFKSFGPTDIEIDGTEYLIADSDQILAILK